LKKAYVGNAADAEQVQEADRKERFEVKTQVKDLKAILSTQEGKRFIWRMVEQCGVYRGGFLPRDESIFRDGEQNIGIWLLAQVTEANPNALIEMMKQGEKEE
jgi:hypothetical protein